MAADATPAEARVTYTGLVLRRPDFRWLWLGSGGSRFGDAVHGVALVWLATHTASPGLAVGLIAFALYTPPIVVGPFAGALADRFDRRRLLIGADLLRVTTAAVVPLAFVTVGLPAVIAATLAHSLISTLFNAAYNAALPEVAGRDRVVAANGLMQTTGYLTSIAGAGIGGVLVAFTPLALPFLVNAVTFAWSAAMVWLVTPRLLAVGAGARRSSYVASLGEGLGYARRQPAVLLYMLIGVVATIGFSPAPVAVVGLANQTLHAGSQGYGLLQAASSLGYAAGAALAGRLISRQHAAGAMAAGYLAMAAGTVALALSGSLWVATPVMLLRSACNSVLMVTGVSIVQLKVENEYRGRVFTLIGSAQELPRPFILPLAGAFMDVVGVSVTLLLMSVFIALAGLIAVAARPALRPVERSLPGPGETEPGGTCGS
jgi:MFS family permease